MLFPYINEKVKGGTNRGHAIMIISRVAESVPASGSFILLFLLIPLFGLAQVRVVEDSRVGVGIDVPAESAKLHVHSTSQGFLMPRMTLAQRNTINPVDGLQVYVMDGNDAVRGPWYFDAGLGIWIRMSWTPADSELDVEDTDNVVLDITLNTLTSDLTETGVHSESTPQTYLNANISVDRWGRITWADSGVANDQGTLNSAYANDVGNVQIANTQTEIGSVTISPQSDSSKILVVGRASFRKGNNTNYETVQVFLCRDGVPIGQSCNLSSLNTAGSHLGPAVLVFEDVSSDTTPIEYGIYAIEPNSGVVYAKEWELEAIELLSLVGPQGIQGPQGPEGPEGPAGPQGEPGPAGSTVVLAGDGITVQESGDVYTVSALDIDPENELQNLTADTMVAGKLSIEGGNTVYINVNDADHDPTNELQELVLTGSLLHLNPAKPGSDSINLSQLLTDPTNLSISGVTSPLILHSSTGDDILIEAGSHISLVGLSDSSFRINNTYIDEDSDPENELQYLWTNLESGHIGISGINDILINVNDADADTLNELQELILTGNQLSLNPARPGSVPVDLPNGETDLSVTDITVGVSLESSTGDSIDIHGIEGIDVLWENEHEFHIGISDNGVTTEKLVNGSVTTPKLANGSVTTDKIGSNQVTIDKLPAGAANDLFLRGDGTWVGIGPGTTDLSVADITVGVVIESSTGDSVAIHGVEGIDVLWENEHEFHIGIADGGVTTAKLADSCVTIEKMYGVVNDPNYFLNGEGDWVEITDGGVLGSGTENYVVKWSPGGDTLTDSQIFDNGISVGIGTINLGPDAILQIAGRIITQFPSDTVENLLIGTGSGNENLFGSDNLFLGRAAGNSVDTANYNIMIGLQAGQSIEKGYDNIIIGRKASVSTETHSGVIAIGAEAQEYANKPGGHESSTYARNISIGYRSLRGDVNLSNQSLDNVAIGYASALSNSTGNSNTSIGNFAQTVFTTGNSNVSVGYYSMYETTSGSFNTVVGAQTRVKSGATGNTVIGYDAKAIHSGNSVNNGTSVGRLAKVESNNATAIGYSSTASYINSGAFGNGAIASADNKIRIGNNNIVEIGGIVGWSNLSDGRFKLNVTEDVPGLEFITLLRPVTYNLDIDSLQHHITAEMPDSVAELYYPSEGEIAHADTIVRTGFIAQEVDSLAKSIDYKFDGVYLPQNSTDNYSISYSSFVPSLVKAIQEQQQMIAAQQELIDNQHSAIEALMVQNAQILQSLSNVQKQLESVKFPSDE